MLLRLLVPFLVLGLFFLITHEIPAVESRIFLPLSIEILHMSIRAVMVLAIEHKDNSKQNVELTARYDFHPAPQPTRPDPDSIPSARPCARHGLPHASQ